MFLDFIAFAISERLSYFHISRIGKFLKDMLNRKNDVGLNFFKTQNFD